MRIKTLETAVLRKLSVAADCDPATVARCYRRLQRGEEVRGRPSQRAKGALIADGLIAEGLIGIPCKFDGAADPAAGFDAGKVA